MIGRELKRVSETGALGTPEGVAETGARLAGMKGFGPYRVVGVLGRGGMGAVFEVEHRELGVRHALKTILASSSSPGFEAQLKRFKLEAELNARLDHPGIQRVHSASFEGQIPYLVVDLLPGGSLGDRLDRGEKITSAEGVSYGLALARALAHAHERGVLHRDLKPDNVMLDEVGGVRLVDFGLALETARETRLTESGVALGTPATMAPEQIQGDRSEGPATDVYGLAATLYWLLGGEPPLGEGCENVAELVVMILEREPEPLVAVRPDVPRALSELLTESMRKEPLERPGLPDWIRVLAALERGKEVSFGREGAGLGPGLALTFVLLLALVGSFLLAQNEERLTQASPAKSPRTSSVQDWKSLAASGAVGEARRQLLIGVVPLSEEDLALLAKLLESATITSAELTHLEGRLGTLSDEGRSQAWGLACLAAGEEERGRQHARRGSETRTLIDLEIERAKIDRERVMLRLTESAVDTLVGRDMSELYDSLLSSLRAWPKERVRQLPVVAQALAGRVLDRLQWTIARVVLVRRLNKRFVGGPGAEAGVGYQVFEAAPDRPGVGRLILRIALLGDDEFEGRRERRDLFLRARRYEGELLADPGGRVLYASYAVGYGLDPVDALRLGGLACNRGERAIGPVDSYANHFLPEMVARAIEAEWLGGDLGEAERGLAEVESYLREVGTVKRKRPKRTYVALIAWYLWRRELEKARLDLEAAEALNSSDHGFVDKLKLFRCELDLARDPVGAAQGVLDRLAKGAANHVEHYGLKAHARALLGLDVREALAEVTRSREGGLGRLGLAWHAFEVPTVIDGQGWWPGRGPAPPSRVQLR